MSSTELRRRNAIPPEPSAASDGRRPERAAADARRLTRRAWLKTAAVGAGAAALSVPGSAQATDIACESAFVFPMQFPFFSEQGGCETTVTIADVAQVPDFQLDVVNTFGVPAGGISSVSVDTIAGAGGSMDLGGVPSGAITIVRDPLVPGTGSMNFAANQYNTVNPLVITLANYPAQQFRTAVAFAGSLSCVSNDYPGEGVLYDLVLVGSGQGVLPPEFPYYGGATVRIVTIAPPQAVPAFGTFGLLTAALGLGGIALKLLRDRRAGGEEIGEGAR